MVIELTALKVGDCLRWWTYIVHIDGVRLASTPTIYRMYTHEKTAIRNGIKLIQKHLSKKQ